MKKIVVLITVIALLLIGIAFSRHPKDKVEMFTDSTGVVWRILTKDNDGNMLIITEHMQGKNSINGYPQGIEYNSTDSYTSLDDSDILRPALNAWFLSTLAPELKEISLPAENVNNDVRMEPSGGLSAFRENESAGLTKAGSGLATPENSLFVLSISEVNKYNKSGNFLGFEVRKIGWLRSPGGGWTENYPTNNTVAIVGGDTESFIWHTSANQKNGFHPALWISSSFVGS